MYQQVECPTCGRKVAKKRNGTFYPHFMIPGSLERYAGNRCPLSNKAPPPSEDSHE